MNDLNHAVVDGINAEAIELLNLKQAAELLHLKPSGLKRLISHGEAPRHNKVGTQYLFNKNDVLMFGWGVEGFGQ